jgi:hypothetical protein
MAPAFSPTDLPLTTIGRNPHGRLDRNASDVDGWR